MRSASREQMQCIDLYSQALHAALMPGKKASMLQLLPSAGKPRSASTEDRRVVKVSYLPKGYILQVCKRHHVPRS